MKVLFDLNVILDVVLNRHPWVIESKQVWDAHQSGSISGWLVATELTNLFYIVRRQADAATARTAVRACLATFDVLQVDQRALQDAVSRTGADFEDDVLIVAAVAGNMDAIVTRDPTGFSDTPIKVLSPTELLARLASTSPPTPK